MTVRQNVTLLIAWMLAMAIPLRADTRTPHQLSCKRVRDAVWRGHTLDQLTAEFHTDAQHIMKCLQAGKGKKRPAAKKGQKGPAPAPEHGRKTK